MVTRFLRRLGRRVARLARPKRRTGRKNPSSAAAADGRSRPEPGVAPSAKGLGLPAAFDVPPAEGRTRFQDLDLPAEVLRAVADLGFRYCMPIQAGVLPHALQGRDIAGRAQTGTGKTAAFLIAILTHCLRRPLPAPRRAAAPRALILAPTRELVIQIEKDTRALGRHASCRVLAVFGGMDYRKQEQMLTEGPVDILVATPGRLLDYRRRGKLDLRHVEILVIDEADRMLDMGFIPDVRTIVHATPIKGRRQTMLFSATLTPEVMRLASNWMAQPQVVEVAPEHVAADAVEQSVYLVSARNKFALLYNLLEQKALTRVLLFCNRRDQTERVFRQLQRYGISSAMMSGDVPQEKRVRILEDFRAGKIRVLAATDVAGRGLHVEAISHVVNYDIPQEPESYVHRIGRTGRAGATGVAITFACEDESFNLPEIEKYIGRELAYVHPDAALLRLPTPPAGVAPVGPTPPMGRRPAGARGAARPGGRRPPRRRA